VPADRPPAAYRRAGADLPFGDPGRDHGAPFEGYYWRLVHPDDGWVIVWLCGVCRGSGGAWATVALAAHPGGFLRHGTLEPAGGDAAGFGAWAGEEFHGTLDRLHVHLAPDARVEARLHPRVTWPRRVFGALGAAHFVPGLPQYWHPVLFAAEVGGEAVLGHRRLRLDGARAYVEKNWGPGFAGRWWWGQANAFPDAELGVAFAGGRTPLLGVSAAPTAVVLRQGDRVLSLAPPLARATTQVGELGWRVRLRSARYRVELEGESAGIPPHLLPVPDVSGRRVDLRSRQLLAGRIRLHVQRGRRTIIDAVSPLAGLELGEESAPDRRPRPAGPQP
jgi:hypothetical protein